MSKFTHKIVDKIVGLVYAGPRKRETYLRRNDHIIAEIDENILHTLHILESPYLLPSDRVSIKKSLQEIEASRRAIVDLETVGAPQIKWRWKRLPPDPRKHK